MKVKYENSLKYKVLERINQIPGSVILRSDVSDLGGYRQIGRALKKLISENKLARISRGIYAKTRTSEYIDIPVLENGFDNVAVEALGRLKIKWDLTTAQKAYNSGATTQVPIWVSVRLKSRCRRQIAYRNNSLRYEGNINAR